MKVYLVYKDADVRYVFGSLKAALRLVRELDPDFNAAKSRFGGVSGSWDDPDSQWKVEEWNVRRDRR